MDVHRATCTSKRTYASAAQAHRALKHAQRCFRGKKPMHAPRALHVYKCQSCQQYHLGNDDRT